MSPCSRCGKEAGIYEFCDECHDENLIEDFYETEWEDREDYENDDELYGGDFQGMSANEAKDDERYSDDNPAWSGYRDDSDDDN
jgi:hypothetical protein